MSPHAATILFQIAVLIFALSLHECAHAWMASRQGDQTARMLGRVTLNPAKHIDPIGTILVPLILFVTHSGILFGWAKPTPVNARNFRKFVRGDMLTTLAGPASNVLSAIVALILLMALRYTSAAGAGAVLASAYTVQVGVLDVATMNALPVLFPIALLLNYIVLLNLVLAIFNMLPLPPLDGSHILRHWLPASWGRFYDALGLFSLVLVFFFGGRVVNFFLAPTLGVFNRLLGI